MPTDVEKVKVAVRVRPFLAREAGHDEIVKVVQVRIVPVCCP